MSEYLPAGAANDPNAPYNQHDNTEEVLTDIYVYTGLFKETRIPISDVKAIRTLECEKNDEGSVDKYDSIEYDYSESNIEECYKNEEYTIIELLQLLSKYIQHDFKLNKVNASYSSIIKDEEGKPYNLNPILKSLQGWKEEELDINLN